MPQKITLLPVFNQIHYIKLPFNTLKMCFSVCSADEGILNMLKWRKKRGVTGFLPPPGGAQAAQMVISWNKDEGKK